jgi:OmpR family response regulator RpaB
MSGEKILVVANETNVRQILDTHFSLSGYNTLLAKNGKDALNLFYRTQPDLIILDLIIPETNGYEVCFEIRKVSSKPIIMLVPQTKMMDNLVCLDLGADDIIQKPFSLKDIEARVKAILRRTKWSTLALKKTPLIQVVIGKLRVDLTKRQVFKFDKRVKLTGMEFNLLELLISRSGEGLSRDFILDILWGYTQERYLDTRVIDVHISRLRSKLEDDPHTPRIILTIRGLGYMFQKFSQVSN